MQGQQNTPSEEKMLEITVKANPNTVQGRWTLREVGGGSIHARGKVGVKKSEEVPSGTYRLGVSLTAVSEVPECVVSVSIKFQGADVTVPDHGPVKVVPGEAAGAVFDITLAQEG